MVTVNITVTDDAVQPEIYLGRQGEKQAREIVFDLSALREKYGAGTATLYHQRSKDPAPYLIGETTGTTLTWTVSETDTVYAGIGYCEFRYTFGTEGLSKSTMFATNVKASLSGDVIIPAATQAWYDALIDYIDEHSIAQDQLAQAVADYIEAHPLEGIPSGGTEGQILVKKTGADFDAEWGDGLSNLKSAFDDITDTDVVQTAKTAATVTGTYINGTTSSTAANFGTGGNSLVVYYIPVESGKKYRLVATNLRTLADSYGFAAFSSNVPAYKVACDVLVNGSTVKVDSVSYDYTATENGYFSVAKGAESNMTYAFYELSEETHIITDKTLSVNDIPADAGAVGKRLDLLGYTTETEKSNVIPAKYTVVNRYIGSDGKIKSAGSNNLPVSWFPVAVGCSYTITGSAKAGGSGQAIVCFDNTYDSTVGHFCKEVIEPGSTTETEYNISYTPVEDGYIVMPQYSLIKLVVTLVSDTDFQRIYNIEKDIESIEAEIGRTKMNVKIQLFGDSITDNLWGDKQTWANFIQQNLSDYNVTVVNDAVGGSGIGHGASKGTTESHQTEEYNHVYDLVTDGVTLQTDANYIVILVGTNNWASGTDLGTMESTGYSTVYGALKGILEYISQHSAATVFVCTIPQRYNTVDQSRETNANGEPLNPDGVSLADYCEAFRKVSAFYGMPCIHLNEDLGWNRLNISYFCGDGLHPNAKGDKMLAAFICSEIEKHIGKVSYT